MLISFSDHKYNIECLVIYLLIAIMNHLFSNICKCILASCGTYNIYNFSFLVIKTVPFTSKLSGTRNYATGLVTWLGLGSRFFIQQSDNTLKFQVSREERVTGNCKIARSNILVMFKVHAFWLSGFIFFNFKSSHFFLLFVITFIFVTTMTFILEK